MNGDHPMSAEREDGPGLLLCAWLDGELPEAEASAFAARVSDDVQLRRRADDFRRTDALVRNWYGTLAVRTATARPTPPRARPARRVLRLTGLAAAVFLIVGGLFWFWPGASAESRAAEAVQRTGKRAAEAPGILVTFEAIVLTPREQPDARGNREEKRTATGEIRFGPLWNQPLLFRCRETWAATDDEPELVRSWGQTVIHGAEEQRTSQWLKEKQGRNVIFREITQSFDPNVPPPDGPLGDDRLDGSPVDLRTRQAVEGLAALVRSFRSDPFLKWMGYAWRQEGGKGTAQEPWRYRMELGPSPEARKGVRTTWVLRLSSKEGVIDRIELEETVVDGQTATLLSSFRTSYKLELRTENWPAGTFDPE